METFGSASHVLILGASARAAAFSALRAGLRPWCADLFADRDLQARCPAIVLPPGNYPQGFVRLIEQAPAGPWMYTGALENRRALVRRLARMRTLWGNDAGALAVIRSPRRLHSILTSAGLHYPAVRSPDDPPPRSGRWLVKPRAGAGGVGIRFRDEKSLPRGKFYLQEFVEGDSFAGIFLAEEVGARLLGVTRQLVGDSWLGAAPFGYCGSVGPVEVPPSALTALRQVGETLTRAAGLRGLFGVDFVLRDGVPWVVEVNPRYTASVEVLEHSTGLRALALHGRVFAGGTPEPVVKPTPANGMVGKAVLFARAPLTFPADGPWMSVLSSPCPVEEMPAFADIPNAGDRIEARRPVLTFFARAGTAEDGLARLRETARDLDARLHDG